MDQNENRQPQAEAEERPELLNGSSERYVERPKWQRVLAWVLAILVSIGVLLYFGWISGIIHV